MKIFQYIFVIVLIVQLASCSGTKGLQQDDKLLESTFITYKDKENITSKKEINAIVQSNILKQNTPGLFNIKTGLYNLIGDNPKNQFTKGIKYGMGSKPIVYNNDMITISEKRLKKALEQEGYIQTKVDCQSFTEKRKVTITCDVNLGPRYRIDSIFYIQDSLEITKTLRPMYTIDYTKSGDYYKIKNLEEDRAKFVKTANDNGFPLVNNQDVIFFLDTLQEGNKVDIHMRLRPSKDALKYERFRYGGIYINPNYSLQSDNSTDTSNMIKYGEYHISEGYNFLREAALNKAIFINEGNIYNQNKRRITTDRLLDFGIFKFVNIKTVINSEKRTLDHFLNLTTHKMESITGELELNNRQGNYLGLQGKVTYSNKNIFHGAERLDVSLTGGLETQFFDKQPFINTSDIKLKTTLTLPDVVIPFVSFRKNRNFIPKTFMSLSLNQQRRVQFYTAREAQANYGFKWNETAYKTSHVSPINLSWQFLSNTTPEFEALLLSDPRLALSFQTTLVLSSSYVYTYNKRDKYNPVNQTFFKGTIESAGNLFSLFAKPKTGQSQGEFFGTPYAQFVRFTADFRKYWAISSNSIATRILVGTGFAYGNSDELPYSKQYSIGGSNSLRAYRLRTLGPGTSRTTTTNANQFIDQTGDIKLESSVEYRFPILGYFKGALFIDAGNIWLNESATRPEGVFKLNKFYKELAIGTGIGIRFDVNFMVIRLDLAFPIRDLTDTGQFEWVGGKIDFFNTNWRTNNLVYNFGIGYPF